MRGFIAFTKKELMENVRTYKLFIMFIVFLLLGMMNPILAKYTPAILEAAAPAFAIAIPEPTAIDAWAQFFGNVGQLGLLALVIVYSGVIAGELSHGTLVNILTKGMRRSTVILSKFITATAIWTTCYLLCLAVSYAYTVYFWGAGGLSHVFIAFFSLWLFGVLLISLVIFGGVLFTKTFGSLLFTGGVVVVMVLFNLSPTLQAYNPMTLTSCSIPLLTAQKAPADVTPALGICTALIAGFMVGSVAVFRKKQI